MQRLPRFLSESRTLAALALPIVLSQVANTLLPALRGESKASDPVTAALIARLRG